MKIELKEIPVREVFEGYKDNEEAGVIGYGGKLNIRPPYQREFIYKEKQREEVIRTIRNRFPLNVMYWAKNGDGTFELLDGQQRTISICQYLAGDYSIKFGDYSYTYHNLTEIEREHLNQYKLMIYISNDGDKEEDVELSIKFMTYSGLKRNKRMYSAKVASHTAQKVQEIDLRQTDRKNEFVYIKLRTFKIHRELTLLLDEISECAYEIPKIDTKLRMINPRSYSIRLSTNKPAFAVHLVMEGTRGNFSDSFFEVRPEGEKSVIFSSEEDLGEEDVKERLKIFDLASSLKK